MSNLRQNAVEPEYREKDASPMRKVIAKRMAESKLNAPHFYLTVDADMGKMVELRNRLNRERENKISFNDLIIKGCAIVLKKHPELNVSYVDDKIRYYKEVNISLAVAVEDGLITPTIRNCDLKNVEEINKESLELIEKARKKKLRPRDWMGGTFTLTNLGMFGIEEFIAILNPPQALILALGAIRETPVAISGKVEIGLRMKMTLSCDHRAVDGAMGAVFLSELKKIIENPGEYLI